MNAAARRPVVLLAVPPQTDAEVFPRTVRADLDAVAEVRETFGRPWDQVPPSEEVRVVITGWGTPTITAEAISRFPNADLVLHSAGSVRVLLEDAVWERGVRVSTAAAANNSFVADYTLAQILLALKGVHHGWAAARGRRSLSGIPVVPGSWHQSVGLVSFGSVARQVRERLPGLHARVLAWDPFVHPDELRELDVEPVASLEELFGRSRVVSMHTPLIPGVTEDLVGRDLLRRLGHGAVFINTARGALVDEAALAETLRAREDLFAILDVTRDEPPADDSPLWDLPNVQLSGHVAGATGSEREALGAVTVAELRRFLAGQPLLNELRRADAMGGA